MFLRVFIFFLSVTGVFFGKSQSLKFELIGTYYGHTYGVSKVAFSPNGEYFVSGGVRGELLLWSTVDTSLVEKLDGHYGAITDLQFFLNGKYLVSTGDDGQLKVWDLRTKKCIQQNMSPNFDVLPINKLKFCVVDNFSEHLFFGGSNKEIYRVGLGKAEKVEVIYKDPTFNIQCAILANDRKELILGAENYLITIDIQTGKKLREFNTGNCFIKAFELSADQQKIYTWCDDSRVDVRKTDNFRLITSFKPGSGQRKFSNLLFTKDQKYIITGDYASRFNVWDISNKQQVLDQGSNQGTIMSFDLDKGPNYLVSASLDKSIKYWKIVEDSDSFKKSMILDDFVAKSQKQKFMESQQNSLLDSSNQSKKVTDSVHLDTNNINLPTQIMDTTKIVLEKETKIFALPERLFNRRIRTLRNEHKFKFKSKRLIIDVWDAQIIDGDVVSIYINDFCALKEYAITASKKTLTFDATGNSKVYLFLHAHNLGKTPPNTATISISDGLSSVVTQLRSDLTGTAVVEISFLD